MDWTSMRLASRVARMEEYGDEAKTRLHRVIRNFVAKGVIPTALDEDDGRGTLRFDDYAAAVVLLLLPLAEGNVDVRGLREIASYLLGSDVDLTGGQPGIVRTPQRRIERLVSAVREGKTVYLVSRVSYRRLSDEWTRTTSVEIEGEARATGEAAELLDSYKLTVEVQMTQTVPANTLLRPLLADGE